MDQNSEFMNALALDMPDNERLIMCGFVGDPETMGPTAWKPRPWRPGKDLPFGPKANTYTTVASFYRAPDKSWRRRGELFAAGRALMIDDIGTKLPYDFLGNTEPTALIETSPNNFQAWFFLSEPLYDRGKFDAIIRAFIAQKLLGADPGMSGVTRVGRTPLGTNSKKKYGGNFATRILKWDPALRWSADRLIAEFNLKLNGTQERKAKLLPEDVRARASLWCEVHKFLESSDMLKREEPDLSGWTEMRCPWVNDHSGRSDTGAALREPAEDNGYYGAFRCHHGHCASKGWRELAEWVSDEAIEKMDMINAKHQEQ